MSAITGAAMVAGIIGRPVTHSLSPVLHNAWIEAAGLNAVYAPLSPAPEGFRALVDGLRGGVISGTPTVIASTASYTVTATNSGGSTTFDVVINKIGRAHV